MGKISTYAEVASPSLGDLLIGTDIGSNKATKNFSISDVLSLASVPPLDDVLNSGSTSDQSITLTGTASLTAPLITSGSILKVQAALADNDNSFGDSGQALVSTGTGVEWQDIDLSMSLVLDASSTAGQGATQLDTPISLSFGAAQGGASDPVMIDASGNITFNQAGVYLVKTFFNAIKLTAGGVSHLMFRGRLGAEEISAQKVLFIDKQNFFVPYEETVPVVVDTPSTILKFDMIRDSGASGDNSGDVRSYTGSGTFDPVPSASVKIWKQEI